MIPFTHCNETMYCNTDWKKTQKLITQSCFHSTPKRISSLIYDKSASGKFLFGQWESVSRTPRSASTIPIGSSPRQNLIITDHVLQRGSSVLCAAAMPMNMSSRVEEKFVLTCKSLFRESAAGAILNSTFSATPASSQKGLPTGNISTVIKTCMPHGICNGDIVALCKPALIRSCGCTIMKNVERSTSPPSQAVRPFLWDPSLRFETCQHTICNKPQQPLAAHWLMFYDIDWSKIYIQKIVLIMKARQAGSSPEWVWSGQLFGIPTLA